MKVFIRLNRSSARVDHQLYTIISKKIISTYYTGKLQKFSTKNGFRVESGTNLFETDIFTWYSKGVTFASEKFWRSFSPLNS